MKEKTTKKYEASTAKTIGDKKRLVITANSSKTATKKPKGCSGCSRRRKVK